MKKKILSMLVVLLALAMFFCCQTDFSEETTNTINVTTNDDYSIHDIVITDCPDTTDSITTNIIPDTEVITTEAFSTTTPVTTPITTPVTTEAVITSLDIKTQIPARAPSFTASDIPASNGSDAYAVINDNVPFFTQDELTVKAYEFYSELDSLGRCGYTVASVCKELMPTEERESIGSVKPSGWQTVKYDFVEGQYLYNRCHLIGFQLAGENANKKNLVTGTRYLNVQGMLPFENLVADYVKETGNHVMYRSTPIFEGDNLVCAGVLMEGYSVEDKGDGVEFCVFAYNIQPGVIINYATGESSQDETTTAADTGVQTYILNTNSKLIHYPSCSSVSSMSDKNKKEYTGTRDELIAQGYKACSKCKP